MCQPSKVRLSRVGAWLFAGLIAVSGCGGQPQPATPGSEDFDEGLGHFSKREFPEAIASFEAATKANPKLAEAFFYLAAACREVRGTDEAITAYGNAIAALNKAAAAGGSQSPPKNGSREEQLVCAYWSRGLLSSKINDYPSAIDDFTQAIKLDPYCAAAYFGRGGAFLAKGLPEPAVDDFKEATKLKADYQEAYCQLARAQAALENYTQAIENCRLAIRLNPKCAAAYQILGLACASAVAPDFPHSIAYSKEALRLDPNLAAEINAQIGATYWKWALALSRAGDSVEAEVKRMRAINFDEKYSNSEYLDLFERTKSPSGLVRQTTAKPVRDPDLERLDLEAYDHLARRQFDAAILKLDQALQIDAKDHGGTYGHGREYAGAGFRDIGFDARYGRGLAYLEKGFPDIAIEDFNLAIGINSKSAAAYCQRSLASSLLGNYLRAARDATDAILLESGLALAYYHRAIAYLNNNNFDRALKDLAEAKHLDPGPADQPPPLLEQAFRRQDVRYPGERDRTEAIHGLQGAIDLVPKWTPWLAPRLAGAYRGRGLDRARDEDFSQAIRDLSEAVRLVPTDAKNYRARGRTYYEMRDWSHAAVDLRQALNLDPSLDYELRRPLEEAERHAATTYTAPPAGSASP
jgi:tetratricopeptide (TPR) repeat protein